MAENATVAGEFATAKRLVELLEQDGFRLDAAVWVPNEEGNARLYLVPHVRSHDKLAQTIRVARTIADHKDELPDRHELRYSVVEADHPVIKAVRSISSASGKVSGAYKDGTYVDSAYIFRPAA